MKKIFTTVGLFAAFVSAAAAASADTTVAKKGEVVGGVLQQTISSKTNHDGDTFTLVEKSTFFHHNPALSGATFDGHVENVTPKSATHKATMTVVFDDVKLADGSTEPIQAKLNSLQSFEPKTHHVRDVGLVVGGAVVGHMFAKKHHGGLGGAAAGFALASTLKSDIDVKQGTLVKLVLTEPLVEGASGASPSP